MIPFHVPYRAARELEYIQELIASSSQKSGNGIFYSRCQQFVQTAFQFENTIFTNSCTDALELAALLLDIKPGDEVILPSYTFVSTANAFLLRGAKLIFCDSQVNNPNIDISLIPSLISEKTKAVVVVHYGGRSCDMELLMELSNQNGFIVVEDAAQCIGAKYSNDLTSTFIGTRAHLSAFSFHDTKNLHCGEGGLLIINDEQFVNRAEIIKDKGTNRGQFNRGEIDKYTWVDIGSSYLPGEYNMAVLLAQLQEWEIITSARQEFWNLYNGIFGSLNDYLPPQSAGNGHNYYLTFKSANQRDDFANRMKQKGIQTAFHYQPLHASIMAKSLGIQPQLLNADKFGNGLLRFPLYPHLSENEVHYIAESAFDCLHRLNS
ncbi:MAG: dTDP-4-amino-4,6-dideoxygalactose transaminase [Bacteroidota bacterium]|jgi:dTDP-4-amino-4,6-dideoxygalactose transaminase